MAEFNSAIVELLNAEGGYQDEPTDPGNYNQYGNLIGTNWGVTPRTYNEYFGRWPTVRDMKALPYITAMDIHKALRWDRYSLGQVIDQKVANHVFDTLILHGRGTLLIQRAANTMGAGLAEDNRYGSRTADAVIRFSSNPKVANKFNNRLVAERLAYVNGLVEANPTMARWLPIWKSRILQFHTATKVIKIVAVVGLLAIGLTAFPQVRSFIKTII